MKFSSNMQATQALLLSHQESRQSRAEAREEQLEANEQFVSEASQNKEGLLLEGEQHRVANFGNSALLRQTRNRSLDRDKLLEQALLRSKGVTERTKSNVLKETPTAPS